MRMAASTCGADDRFWSSAQGAVSILPPLRGVGGRQKTIVCPT